VTSDTVYRWIDKHSMPAHRMGRLWKFKKDELDEWVKTGGAVKRTKRGLLTIRRLLYVRADHEQ